MTDHKERFFEALGVTSEPWEPRDDVDGYSIPGVFDGVAGYGGWYNGATEADARLIAEAPEMLLELIDAVSMLEWYERKKKNSNGIGTSVENIPERYWGKIKRIESTTGRPWSEVRRIYEETKEADDAKPE